MEQIKEQKITIIGDYWRRLHPSAECLNAKGDLVTVPIEWGGSDCAWTRKGITASCANCSHFINYEQVRIKKVLEKLLERKRTGRNWSPPEEYSGLCIFGMYPKFLITNGCQPGKCRYAGFSSNSEYQEYTNK